LLFALMLPALLAGVWTGTRLVGRFQEEAVRRLVLIILIGMAILIGAQAILHLLQR
jgi:uncharacterized membrane protein YfcA